ncbi:9304_t:CDS:1 [Acaulospora colombiana]|uniref:9304_t:CDS:1 n=1 Tax=Acaulospora colombiana TaxID=27376 RepID=A0ACA9K1S4_9GLOM|nr:9304_t:CDS:1 [Acaulospora colombiana]
MPNANEIIIKEFINRSEERIGTKTPNGFFVYRRVFTKELSKLNHKPSMSSVSKMAAWQWHNEDRKFREEYEEVATTIGKRIKEHERELSKAFFGKFIPYIPQEHLSYSEPSQQGVKNEKLLKCLVGERIKGREHELNQAFFENFIPRTPHEPLPTEGSFQQGVIDEELERHLYESYFKGGILDEFL